MKQLVAVGTVLIPAPLLLVKCLSGAQAVPGLHVSVQSLDSSQQVLGLFKEAARQVTLSLNQLQTELGSHSTPCNTHIAEML